MPGRQKPGGGITSVSEIGAQSAEVRRPLRIMPVGVKDRSTAPSKRPRRRLYSA